MDIQKERYKRIRGLILKLLAHQHPGCVDMVALRYTMDDLRYPMTENEFESHLSYLSEKALLSIERRKSSGVDIKMIVITPRGLDVLDGWVKEEGIDTEA